MDVQVSVIILPRFLQHCQEVVTKFSVCHILYLRFQNCEKFLKLSLQCIPYPPHPSPHTHNILEENLLQSAQRFDYSIVITVCEWLSSKQLQSLSNRAHAREERKQQFSTVQSVNLGWNHNTIDYLLYTLLPPSPDMLVGWVKLKSCPGYLHFYLHQHSQHFLGFTLFNMEKFLCPVQCTGAHYWH